MSSSFISGGRRKTSNPTSSSGSGRPVKGSLSGAVVMRTRADTGSLSGPHSARDSYTQDSPCNNPSSHPSEHRASIGNPEGVALAMVSRRIQQGDLSLSEQSSPARCQSPSRRSTLFSSFRKGTKSQGKASGAKQLIASFPVPGSRRRGSDDAPEVDSAPQASGHRASVDGPVKSKAGGFWDAFRPRSKSDSRNIIHRTKPKPEGVRQYPARLETITSLDEHCEHASHITEPLRVDTDLANRTASRGPASDRSSGSRGRNVSQAIMDRLLADHFRRRSYSTPHSHNVRDIRRRSDSRVIAGTKINNVTATSTADNIAPLTGTQLKVMPQHSLDSFLAPGVAGKAPSAVIYKTESQQFFIGNDLTALAVSSLENENLVYTEFMRVHRCYDLIPTSSKLVVFDTQLLVKKAFFALVYNSVRAAPLWDSTSQQFVGMLTITDFITILLRHYDSSNVNLDVEEHKICTWKDTTPRGQKPNFFSIDINESLFEAVKLLCDKKVHRLPVINSETGNVLYILTHKRLLRLMHLYMNDLPKPKWMQNTPKELGIGSWKDIITIRAHTKLIDVLHIFSKNRVSALPIVDANGILIDIYAKFDVINIAAEKAYNNLEIPVTEALRHRVEWFEGVHHCYEDDSLWTVIEALVKHEVHRMIITDMSKRVIGVVSLSDLLTFLVVRPALEAEQTEANEQHRTMVEVPAMDCS